MVGSVSEVLDGDAPALGRHLAGCRPFDDDPHGVQGLAGVVVDEDGERGRAGRLARRLGAEADRSGEQDAGREGKNPHPRSMARRAPQVKRIR